MTTREINIGVWSCGTHTYQHRLPGFRALDGEGVRVRVLGDPVPGVAARMADELSSPEYVQLVRSTGYPIEVLPTAERPAVTRSLDELLEHDLDAVVVVSPHRFHAPAAKQVMRSGRHALVEKPMATSLEDAQEMVEIAERQGLVLAIGYQMALAPQPALAAETGRARVGLIVAGEAKWRRDLIPPDEHFWNDLGETGVGRDFLPHPLAAWIAAQGEDSIVEVLDATGTRDVGVARFGDRFKGFDSIRATLRLDTGGTLELDTSWVSDRAPDDASWMIFHAAPDSRLEVPMPVHKRKGYVPNTEAWRAVTRTARHGTEVGPATRSFTQLIIAQNRNWVDVIRGEEPHLAFTARQALAAELWVDRIQELAVRKFLAQQLG